MPRYIDADALIRDVCGHYCGCEPEECGYTDHEPWRECLHVKRIIDAPTISPDDVRGVGKWIKNYDRVKWWYECSCCHEKPLISRFGDTENLSAYCPNCGAKMEVSEDA